ncbi:MAG TPA: OpcA/G6PD domain-containing protein, partial [Trebonia sp.]|nr:OpcA/G6PD domain-containing protein [Trebonia sp.]
GPGITRVSFVTSDGDITISRLDGRTATLSWPERPDRMVALHRRETAELLAEELRRLDPDDVYAETLNRLDARGFDSDPVEETEPAEETGPVEESEEQNIP